MKVATVNFRTSVRRIAWPIELGQPQAMRRLILDACEIPFDATIFVYDHCRVAVSYDEILASEIAELFVEVEDYNISSYYPSAHTLVEMLTPPTTPHIYQPIPDVETFEDVKSGKKRDDGAPVSDTAIERQAEFVGSSFQTQLYKFQRILAHLVNERTVLAWFRTNLAFVTLSLKYLKYGDAYYESNRTAALILFLCGAVFMIVLPFSWYSGFQRFRKCKEMLDYNITQLSNYLYKMGFDFDNNSLGFIIATSFLGISMSSFLLIWAI